MNPRRIAAGLKALGLGLLATTASAAALAPRQNAPAVDSDALALLSRAADSQVQSVIDGKQGTLGGSPRGIARAVRRLVVPFVWPDSTYYHDESLLTHVDEMLDALTSRQHCDGTYSVGNRHSPPDTGFLIEDFGIMVRILEDDEHEASQPMADIIRSILKRAGPGLAAGGVHTPNHRWKICAALARIANIVGDEDGVLVDRIDEWLAEGIDIDADGIHSERSPIYYAAVSNPSLLTVAKELNRTELVDVVRLNLELSIEHSEPGGQLESIQSRRQDQNQPLNVNLWEFYAQFRELALRDESPRFAAVVRHIEANAGLSNLADFLALFIERPALAAVLPDSDGVNPWSDFDKHYKTAGLVRSRRGKLSASVFGGTDWYKNGQQTPFYNRFGSGLSTNPSMFRAWNGKSVLEGVRLVPNFFSMGHFRSNGIAYENGVCTLGSEMEVPYYLPMPADQRNEDGVYALGRSVADGRFYAMLDFENRPASMRRLRTDVAVKQTDKGYDLEFEISGEKDVEMTLELTFRAGGSFSGTGLKEAGDEPAGTKTYQLVEGEGEYTVGDDKITFGPGNGEGWINNSGGEQYSWHNGALTLQGDKVYVTGVSPWKYTLHLGFS